MTVYKVAPNQIPIMSATQIQEAFNSIRLLEPEERVHVLRSTISQLTPELAYAMFDKACADGKFDAIIAEVDADFEAGRVLDSIY